MKSLSRKRRQNKGDYGGMGYSGLEPIIEHASSHESIANASTMFIQEEYRPRTAELANEKQMEFLRPTRYESSLEINIFQSMSILSLCLIA